MPLLPFAAPVLADAPPVRLLTRGAQQSDLAFANIYLLRRKYHTELALEGGFLFRHFSANSRLCGYAFPCGEGDPFPALCRMEEDATLRARPFRFCLLTESQKDFLALHYPGRFVFSSDPGDADYLYEREALATLPGARLHRKRNHVARFERSYPTTRVEALTDANASDALAVASAWLAAQEDPTPALLHEHEAITQALIHREALELVGALLYVGDSPVGMSLASMISPTVADIHYEKCLPDFRSAYPVINQAMASLLPATFINREEDLNQPGLRQAKLSYFPFLILTKFNATPC